MGMSYSMPLPFQSTFVHRNVAVIKPVRRWLHFRRHPHRSRSQVARNFRIPEYGRRTGSDHFEVVDKEWRSNKAARDWD